MGGWAAFAMRAPFKWAEPLERPSSLIHGSGAVGKSDRLELGEFESATVGSRLA